MISELKPCPFCGGKAKISEMDIGDCNPKTYYSVSCGTEGCWVYENQDYWEDDTKEVADRWNTRPAETQAIERTKVACIKAIRQLEGADCDYIYYEDNPEYIIKDDAISAIRTVDQ